MLCVGVREMCRESLFCCRASEQILDKLAASGHVVTNATPRDVVGRHVLHAASLNGRLDVVERLIDSVSQAQRHSRLSVRA